MAHMSMKITWNFELDGPEFTIMSKALTGNLKPAEKRAAYELAKRLAEQRVGYAEQAMQIAEGMLQHVLTTNIPEEGAEDAKA